MMQGRNTCMRLTGEKWRAKQLRKRLCNVGASSGGEPNEGGCLAAGIGTLEFLQTKGFFETNGDF